VFGVAVNAMAIAGAKSQGVMDRYRSMPIARFSVPCGQSGSDLLVGTLSVALMAGCGLVVGWRAHEGLWRTLAGFGVILLFRYALTWVGLFIGLAVRSEKSVDNLGPLVFPLTMIGNTFVPTGHMPAWLRTLADWNPVSALTGSSRALFGNPGAVPAHPVWPVAHPVAAALAWSALLLAVFVPLAVRRYRDLDG
jgi:ABC-2 type transport system permease protein